MSKIIKCMFFVLLAAVLPLSVHAQQVTLHLQDVTVRKAFRELEVKGNVSRAAVCASQREVRC